MKQINDFFEILNYYESTQAIISQCVITDYATADDGTATCKVTIPKTTDADDELVEIKDVKCMVGSPYDIRFDDYMSGILIKVQNPITTSQDIANQKQVTKYDYFAPNADALLAIIIPQEETIGNITTAKIAVKKTIYVGDQETNVLKEIAEYLNELYDFFDRLGQYAPTFSSYPANGSAQTQVLGQEMAQKTKELYDKIQPITDYQED